MNQHILKTTDSDLIICSHKQNPPLLVIAFRCNVSMFKRGETFYANVLLKSHRLNRIQTAPCTLLGEDLSINIRGVRTFVTLILTMTSK